MPSKKSSGTASSSKKTGSAKKREPETKLTMPSRKVLIEASLSVLGLATAAAIIFVPSVRSTNASPSSSPAVQHSSWTDFEGGPVETKNLEPASEQALADASDRQIGDP